MAKGPSRVELEAKHCWERDDQVPGRPEMTRFRQRLRYYQAIWRETNGHPIGSQPIVANANHPGRPMGSRLPLDYARETGANFLTAGAVNAAKARLSIIEPNQSIDHQRIWADLLWSPAMAFNLFGELASNLGRADRAVHAWWPDAPGKVGEIRFAHSPGWLDPAYLNSLRVFDAAIGLERPDGSWGIIGVDIKYHEKTKAETPRPSNMWRYRQVADRSGAFVPRAIDKLNGRNDLAVMWLEHLLLLSMLQHGTSRWSWGLYVVVHPKDNSDVRDACARYGDLLTDHSTFAAMTLEELLEARAFPPRTAVALRERYIPA